ncbi:hypothetical protein C7T35_19580 [Variovorax sp. WS11]|uniref:RHS repeat domain-containing protein n=1 Tax=Variovorax sp. WS11 TaxID=1105204 RepID=UPI000D0CA8EC|nr:transglutaminase domain-containing protein [Variovorax sp. WS11]NDZ15670.1 hypothetical protein [Variovorax sp. WS11]PSL82959.1 hypothetical protein C7T35_19580 [Variovorax sp. WS11]
MSKLARACAVVVAVATSLAGGIAAAQMQSGATRKAAPPSVALGVPAASANAKPNISQRSSTNATAGWGSSLNFASGQPALRYLPDDLPTARDPVRREAVKDGAKESGVSTRSATAPGAAGTGEFAPAPGVLRANMPPVTFADAQRVLKARVLPANVNQGVTAAPKTNKTSASASTSVMKISGDGNALGPASIAELARSLRHHPDLIYQYVRNNIEYYPVFGSQKGALGSVLDNQATAHDQATLMVELLRASGVEANYVRGIAKLSAAQLGEWWGVSTANACGVLSLLGQAQIPVYEINATSAGSCPGTVAALTDVSFEHVWVKVKINGSWYAFDPSYKPHTFKSGIDLASAATTGYDAASHLASAQSGATVTGDYVQNIHRANIRSKLAGYATNLAGYLRANKPAATLDDVLGGKTITPFYGALRQSALPYQNTAWGSEELAELPGYMKPTLRIQYQGIDQTYTSDAIYGRRLTLTYNGANQPVLKLDGVAVGNPGTAVTPGTSTAITFTVTHNAYVSTWANHSFTQKIKGGGTNTFLIANGWGPAGRGPAENYRRIQSDLKASGAADASEPLLGSTLAVMGAQWIAQNTHAGSITERIADTTLLHQHQVGIVGYTGSAYVDLPSNVLAVANLAGNVDKESAAFANWGMHVSILESTAVQQTTGVPAVSTVKLIDLASAAGQRIYNATSANYASAVQPNLVNCSAHLANFSNYLASGLRLILPARCDIAENSWAGAGYFTVGSGLYLGSVISNGLSGGHSTYDQSAGAANLASYAYDGVGRRTTVTLGNGTTIERGYDAHGALANLRNFLASPSQGVQYTYTRNQLRELKNVSWTNNLYQWSGATPGTRSYTSNGLNQYTAAGGAAMGYDANGNLTSDGTWSYGYDLDNRLKSANKSGTAASLAYDAEGRLRQTVIGASTTNLLYDAADLIAKYDAAGTTLQRRYVHGPGTDEPIVWYEGSGTTAKNWLYADHLGSIVATANATGASTGIYSYGPYGDANQWPRLLWTCA